MIEDVVEGIFRIIFKVIFKIALYIFTEFIVEVIFEVLIKGAGYIICYQFDPEIDAESGWVIVAGLLFWVVVAGGLTTLWLMN